MGRPRKEKAPNNPKWSLSTTAPKPERMDNFIMHVPVGFENRKHIGRIADEAEFTTDEAMNMISLTLRTNQAVILWDRRLNLFIPKDTADMMRFMEAEGVQALIAPLNQWRRERINWHF